ncbi:MAG: S-methyl-5-thioribose-1-phosphate isomerase [Candidatus Aenigmatarchaeota archaeon]
MLVNGKHYRSVWFENGKVKMINQLALPHKFEVLSFSKASEVAKAIKNMVVRGAPAIGASAAYGMALGFLNKENPKKVAEMIKSTRPTAHDLFDGVDYVLKIIENSKRKEEVIAKANEYAKKSIDECKKIGEFGEKLIKDEFRILTHCNAGWLACVDWGTALSPIYVAKRNKKKVFVFVDETRPRLQGAKLTAWELLNEGIEHAIIADNAAGYYMKKGMIDIVIVGADRIARNGDFANKIGTYEKAVLAKENGIPFYVAAPSSTFDISCKNGDEIVIEERDENEIHYIDGKRITPRFSKAKNPAFDVTPAKYVSGFITPKGIIKPNEIVKYFKPNT